MFCFDKHITEQLFQDSGTKLLIGECQLRYTGCLPWYYLVKIVLLENLESKEENHHTSNKNIEQSIGSMEIVELRGQDDSNQSWPELDDMSEEKADG